MLLLITRRSELFWDELLLLAAGSWLGLSHLRTLFAFGILAAPILSRQLSNSWDQYNPKADRIWPNILMIGTSLLVAILAFPSSQNLTAQVFDRSPVKALSFIEKTHLPGRC